MLAWKEQDFIPIIPPGIDPASSRDGQNVLVLKKRHCPYQTCLALFCNTEVKMVDLHIFHRFISSGEEDGSIVFTPSLATI